MDRFPLSLRKALAFCLLAGACSAAAADLAALLAKADSLEKNKKYQEAIVVLVEAQKVSPDDAEVLRRLAKQHALLSDGAAGAAEKEKLASEALDFALKATQADPKNANARLSAAICYGKLALLRDPKARMEYSRKIYEESRAAVRLDPSNDLAWHVLGRWHYEVATLNPAIKFFAEQLFGKLPDASLDEAKRCFEKAMKLAPNKLLHAAELGRTYSAIGNKDSARRWLERALAMRNTDPDDPATRERARKTLQSL